MKRVAIVTEANEKVASGHLMECIEIANVLAEGGYHVLFMVNDDILHDFQSRITFPYTVYEHDLEIGKHNISERLSDYDADLVIFNFRFIEDKLSKHIRRQFKGIILCIDELGHRHLSCDVIVNPMIDPHFHEYMDSDAKIYVGPKYLVLPRSIIDFHKREKVIPSRVQRICVSMGGVDPFGTTLKLAEWAPRILKDVKIDLILGGGFQYSLEVDNIIAHNDRISVYRNIDYIYELFYCSDIAFCAGGNTLHELACIGTPAIVIPSMPHEVKNGKYFEKHGFGRCLPITHDIDYDDVLLGVGSLLPAEVRKNYSAAGKKIVKGNGAEEVLKIVASIAERADVLCR